MKIFPGPVGQQKTTKESSFFSENMREAGILVGA